jgi:hypothetical protein
VGEPLSSVSWRGLTPLQRRQADSVAFGEQEEEKPRAGLGGMRRGALPMRAPMFGAGEKSRGLQKRHPR